MFEAHPVPEGSRSQERGRADRGGGGPSRRGKTGGGGESRPAEDESDASFITRRHARAGKDGGGIGAGGAKVRWSGGEPGRLEGVRAGRPAFSGRT